MDISRRNGEQYPDPIAFEALVAVARSDRRRIHKFIPLVYICSRYAADEKRTIEQNEAAAVRYSQFTIEQRYIPLASHLFIRGSLTITILSSGSLVCSSGKFGWI